MENVVYYYLIASSAATTADSNSFTVQSITDLSKAINEYGIVTVVLAAMLIGIAGMVLFTFKSNKKHTNNLTELFKQQNQTTIDLLKEQNKNTIDQNELLLKRLTELTDKNKKETNTEKNLINIFMRLNFTLKDECHAIQEQLNCMRVGIYACHNGAKTNTGLPFFKASCISEWISKKFLMNSVMGLHYELQLGIFFNTLEKIFEKGYCVIKDINDVKGESNYKYMNSMGISSSVIIAVLNNDDLNIGAITIEFDHVLTDEDNIDNIIKVGTELSKKIVPLLDYSLYDESDITSKPDNNK